MVKQGRNYVPHSMRGQMGCGR